ncbi:hypothetical protein J5X84_22295 [Streptosporangiaceae bacterium NEAU-GS5]|nr:hypothetical protein [Streptosporangiaceae bacterium NEAU-GS5]
MTPRPMPAAEVEVTPELVRWLLERRHPDLAHLSTEVMAGGWDDVMVRPPADAPDMAARMTGFLTALHLAGASDAPVNPVRGVPLADRAEADAANLATVLSS